MAEKTSAEKIGDMGENIAAALMQKKGFSVVERNYRSKYGEIDIIAADEQYIVFAEVKTRNTSALLRPAGWVDRRKQKKIILTAMEYLSEYENELQPRFDVIEVIYNKNTGIIIDTEHIENAFDMSGY